MMKRFLKSLDLEIGLMIIFGAGITAGKLSHEYPDWKWLTGIAAFCFCMFLNWCIYEKEE